MSHVCHNRIVAVIVLIFIALTCFTPAAVSARQKQSSFEYKKYQEHEQYRNALFWRMNGVFKTISDHMDDSRTMPIPGLVETYSVSGDKKTLSDEFVPQGICRAGRFWLVTAYDADQKMNTVIYVVDPIHKDLLATIALPHRYHAGGIAFDGENVWLTGDTSDRYEGDPFLQYIKFSDLRRMIDDPLHIVSDDEISEPVFIKNKPSFLEYDSGTLWVGTYIGRKNTSESYMYGYKVIKDGPEPRLNTLFLTVISGLDSSAQGAVIDDNSLYVSSSYKGSSIGVRSSFITRYNILPIKEGQQSLSLTSREIKRIEVPKMNEEILVENGKVYVNFESASETWKHAVIMTDRILSLDDSLWY